MKVSVVLMTFNHEPYIAQALDSVLSQELDGGYEVLVTEDCSTDRTRGILADYVQRYPEIIRLLLSPRNLNSNEVLTRGIDAASGEYVALLDGDDYWTDARKLCRQVEFLDSHPGCSSCFHNARIVYDDGRPPIHHNALTQRALVAIDDLWERNPIATCSVMFRNGLITKWPEWYRDLRYGDWPLHLLHAEHGAIGYLDQIMAVYRVHADSVFGGMSEDEQLRDVLAFYDEIDACFEYAHHAGVERGRARHEALLSELTGKRAPSPSSAPVAAPPRTPRPRRRDPDVSVVMIAYNVEDYIEHALESVLMQDGDFSCEVLVGEDCSIDGTRDIVLRYAHEHPDEIRPLLRDSNLGMNPNFSATYLESTGRYIALLDGDDFWTSRLKIAKQIAFMESHPECAICFHNTTVVYDDGTNPQHPFHMRRPRHRIASRVPKPFSAVRDLVAGNFMQTCSVMYRGGLVRELPEWYLSMPTFDWPLHVLHAEHGDIGYIDEVMGTYRVHPGGFWSTGMSRYERVEDVETLIRAYHTLDRHLQHRFSDGIRRALPYFYCEAAAAALRAGDAVKAREYATMVMQSPDAGVERERERATRLLDRLSNR